MQLTQQKGIVPQDFPFDLFVTNINGYPPHWHEETELVYVLDRPSDMSVNDKYYHLLPGDILICHPGDVHHFHHLEEAGNRIIIQFDSSILGPLKTIITGSRFSVNYISAEDYAGTENYEKMKQAILQIADTSREFKDDLVLTYKTLHTYFKKLYPDTYSRKSGRIDASVMPMVYLEDSARNFIKDKPLWNEDELLSFRLAIMSQVFILVSNLREIAPLETLSPGMVSRQRQVLDRLHSVFSWVENNYRNPITLGQAAETANFSKYHFSRFFKQATGITFSRYLNNYRISIAVNHLLSSRNPVSEIAFQSGFSSLKTFNRVFKQLKGVSPVEFRKNSNI